MDNAAGKMHSKVVIEQPEQKLTFFYVKEDGCFAISVRNFAEMIVYVPRYEQLII